MALFDNEVAPRIRVWEPGDMPGWFIKVEWAVLVEDEKFDEGEQLDLGRVCIEWKMDEYNNLMWLKLWFAPLSSRSNPMDEEPTA